MSPKIGLNRPHGFSLMQLLLVIALAAITIGLAASIRRASQPQQVLSLEDIAFSPSGSTLAVAMDNLVFIVDVRTMTTHSPFECGTYDIRDTTFSPDSKYLAIGNMDGSFWLWSSKGLRQLRRQQKGTRYFRVRFPLFSPDNSKLAMAGLVLRPIGFFHIRGSPFNVVEVYDVQQGQKLCELHLGMDIDSWETRLAFSPDGRTLATDSVLFDITTQRILPLGEDREKRPLKLISPDGNTVAVWTSEFDLELQDLATGKKTHLDYPVPGRTHNATSPDGNLLAVGQESPGSVRVLDAKSRKELCRIGGADDYSIQWVLFASAFVIWTTAWLAVWFRNRKAKRSEPNHKLVVT